MFVPMEHARFFGGADLMLNNRGIVDHVVTPTWYVEGRGVVVGEAFRLPKAEASFHRIEEFLPRNVHLNQVEGLELSYEGKLREVWAQMSLRPERQAEPIQSLDLPFGMAADFKSSRLESVWPSLQRGERFVIALANTTSKPLVVQMIDADSSSAVRLAPFGGKTITVSDRHRPSGADWIRLESDGVPSALRATGFVISRTDGIPRLTRFFDPAAPVQENLFATGLPIRDTAVTIAIKNTSNVAVVATAEFLDPETGVALSALPAVQLSAGGATLLQPDLSNLSVDRVGVRIVNSGAPGSLIATMHATNRLTNIGYEMPIRDSGGPRASTGGYPWRLDGDYETVVTITNVGTTAAKFSSRLHYGSTDYVFRTRELAIGATAVINLRQLRDDQVPDAYGRTIPVGLEHGQFYWSVHDQRTGAHFSGRAEIVSRSQKVSSSFSCWHCCPDSTVSWYMDAEFDELSIDVWAWVDPEEVISDCYSNTWSAPASPSYWSYNSSVVSVEYDSGYYLVGVGDGSTTVHAYWGGSYWQLTEPGEGEEWEQPSVCEDLGSSPHVQKPIQVACSVPSNFHETGHYDAGGGTLHFDYAWGSSSGPLKNLSACLVGEKVYSYTSNPFPSPPFPSGISPNDPTELSVAGDQGGAVDNHYTVGTFVKPYASSTVTASQIYRYKCPCNQSNAWVTVMGPHNIVRSVQSNGNGGWKFVITKTGSSATIDPLPPEPSPISLDKFVSFAFQKLPQRQSQR